MSVVDVVVSFSGYFNEKQDYIWQEFAIFDPFIYSSAVFFFDDDDSDTLDVATKKWVGDGNHGVSLNVSNIPQFKVKEVLKRITGPYANIYMKEAQKKFLLEEVIERKCKDLVCEEELPELEYQHCCQHPKDHCVCALNRVIKYGKYYSRKKILDSATKPNNQKLYSHFEITKINKTVAMNAQTGRRRRQQQQVGRTHWKRLDMRQFDMEL